MRQDKGKGTILTRVFFVGKLVSVGVSVLGGGVAKGIAFSCITKKHKRLGV